MYTFIATMCCILYSALPDGERVFAGFLTEEDVTRNYRVSVPYISNPYTTMDQTSREIARR